MMRSTELRLTRSHTGFWIESACPQSYSDPWGAFAQKSGRSNRSTAGKKLLFQGDGGRYEELRSFSSGNHCSCSVCFMPRWPGRAISHNPLVREEGLPPTPGQRHGDDRPGKADGPRLPML